MKKNVLSLLLLAGLLAAAAAPRSRAQGWPESVSFYSLHSTLDGRPAPVGAAVSAYDPGGVVCGTTTVVEPGVYPLLACERDRSDTPEDEGAAPGEVIRFTINGLPTRAVPLRFNFSPVPPSTAITWTRMGDVWEVDLHACTLAGDLDCDCRVTVADLMRPAAVLGVAQGEAGYYPPYDRDGDQDIDSADLRAVAGEWRSGCRSEAFFEPASATARLR